MTPRRLLVLSLALTGLVALGPAPLLAQSSQIRAGFTQFGKNKVQYREFDWQIYSAPHFDVYYYPEEEASLQKVVSFAESAYDDLSRHFDYQIEESTKLIYYSTHSAFEQNNIILNFIPEGTGAFATPVRHRMVLPIDLPDPELMALIRHEMTHIFQYHILFGGSLSRGTVGTPPLWFMEGMASYMAKDETARDKMFLRDAVVNDRIPQVSEARGGGFFAYRFGHAVFDYMEERWGRDGFLDFVFAMRGTFGGRAGPAIEQAFGIEPEDFDREFRAWLRDKYLPLLVDTGEPLDFGRPFTAHEQRSSQETSPAGSPAGGLVAAFSTVGGDLDVLLFGPRERKPIRNLTKGYTSQFRYFVAQELSLGRASGGDIAFSPDGNRLAIFAKRGPGRSLVILDVLKGGVVQIIDLEVEQPYAPSWSPDGTRIAFSGYRNGQYDIFTYEFASGEVRNLTNDPTHDAAPGWAPDGESLVMTSVYGEHAKLVRLDLDRPDLRHQLTFDDSEEADPVYGPDGTIYFTSDRTGAQNIYSLDPESGRVVRHTNAVTGCFQPTILPSPEGSPSLVSTCLWRGRFDLYITDLADPVSDPVVVVEGREEETEPVPATELPRFEPAIDVAVDDANKSNYRFGKFHLEDAGTLAGFNASDQIPIGYVYLSFSDELGDHRILVQGASVDRFESYFATYANLRNRWQWNVDLFYQSEFFVVRDQFNRTGRIEDRIELTEIAGATAGFTYPFDLYRRFEIGAGYIQREQSVPVQAFDPETGLPTVDFVTFEDDFPLVQTALVGDTAAFAPWGAISGRRWRLGVRYAPNTDESGTLARDVTLDLRQYLPVSRRSNLAIRLYGAMSDGDRPNLYYFGGLDTLRGVDFRSFNGDRAFFANLEYRFPLIDQLTTPAFDFRGIRGRVFLDVGGAWFDSAGQDFDFWNDQENRLEDALASYGLGLTVNLFGLDLNFDFSKLWDGDQTLTDGYETSFWIGRRF